MHMRSTKNRIIGILLAGVFALFNIGLPIVVASCPMMKFENSRSCMMCNDDQSAGVKLTRAIDRSCCATVFAADRNKTEFLQATKNLQESSQYLLTVVSDIVSAFAIRDPQAVNAATASPPRSADIPILVSSLLI
jgi:hypothetical protein